MSDVKLLENQPLRALVVEDEWPARNYLVELLQESQLADVVAAVATVDDAIGVLQGARDETEPPVVIDVVFADVQLVGDDRENGGMELVRMFANKDGAPLFVLATAFKEHAVEAFNLGVVDYLLKPFTEERVVQCLHRLQRHRSSRSKGGPSRIVARKKKALVFLKPEEVWAFEAADRLTFVHTTRGRFDLDLSLAAIEASFGRSLLRVHRNWLVNTVHVQELVREGGETELLVGQTDSTVRVPVARERAPLVRDELLANATGLRRA